MNVSECVLRDAVDVENHPGHADAVGQRLREPVRVARPNLDIGRRTRERLLPRDELGLRGLDTLLEVTDLAPLRRHDQEPGSGEHEDEPELHRPQGEPGSTKAVR